MPSMMSFAKTTRQVREQTKTVTRRKAWLKLKAGTVLWAVEKAQGLKLGEHVKKICLIRVKNVRREPLYRITAADVRAEGFAGWTRGQFIHFYCVANGGTAGQMVTRIAFEYLSEAESRVYTDKLAA